MQITNIFHINVLFPENSHVPVDLFCYTIAHSTITITIDLQSSSVGLFGATFHIMTKTMQEMSF
jgi:hypothetical protein